MINTSFTDSDQEEETSDDFETYGLTLALDTSLGNQSLSPYLMLSKTDYQDDADSFSLLSGIGGYFSAGDRNSFSYGYSFSDSKNNKNSSDLEKLNKSKMANGETVEDSLVALIAKMGEKITLGKAKTFSQPGSKNFNYLHTVVKDNLSKLSVITSLETSNDSEDVKAFGKQLSMHIAASNPLALSSDLIDKDLLQKEQDLVAEELKNSGKPAEIAQKISLGKMNKFKEENALLTQAWVMEPKKKVQDIVKELNIPDLKIKNFFRIKIGE